MFPNELFLGITLYDILMALGIVLAALLFKKLLHQKQVPESVIQTYYTFGLISIFSGLVAAVLFQATYDFIETGIFQFTGMTFLGGLLGGAAVFLLLYFKKATQEEKKYIHTVTEAAFVAVLLGHFIGRIGCFTAGCCYGIETDSFLGIHFPGHDHAVHPTQLYEAFLLLILFVVAYQFYQHKHSVKILYLLGYGIGRFLIEFLRGDERGSFIPFLSPSQTWSLLLVALGIYFWIQKRKQKEQTTIS